jgi:hypothetical protein
MLTFTIFESGLLKVLKIGYNPDSAASVCKTGFPQYIDLKTIGSIINRRDCLSKVGYHYTGWNGI